MIQTPGITRKEAPGDERGGSILVPCLIMLSLLSLLTLAVLNAAGIGNSSSSILAQKTQAHFAALSGVEIAYLRLASDPSYSGEECSPFSGNAGAIDITVNSLGDSKYEVLARGLVGETKEMVRTRASATPFSLYPLTVGHNVSLYGNSKILGDCYVENVLSGKDKSEITGSVYLKGARQIAYDAYGKAISIDGYPAPIIGGEIYTDAPSLDIPKVFLENLRDLAVQSGQLYTESQHFTCTDLTGVIYFEGFNAKPFFDDVTLDGILVCDGVSEIRVEGGFLKIHCDDGICPKVALLAPNTHLWVDPNSTVDVYGLALVYSADFQGSGTFTGSFMVLNDLSADPNSYLYCQIPSEFKNFTNTNSLWTEESLTELEYEEL